MPLPTEALTLASLLSDRFQSDLQGLWLHGSALSEGGLRPLSDVDLLLVLARSMTDAERDDLLREMLAVSGPWPRHLASRRPVELVAFTLEDLAGMAYRARADFVYGEWLRAAYEAGARALPSPDPEFTLLLAQARQQSHAIIGPKLAQFVPEIAYAAIIQASADMLPGLMSGLADDTSNVLLTLARMWRTVTHNDFVPKHHAADWAIPALSPEAASMLVMARDNYLGLVCPDWPGNGPAVEQAAQELRGQINQAFSALA